jgi:hypothetical protein
MLECQQTLMELGLVSQATVTMTLINSTHKAKLYQFRRRVRNREDMDLKKVSIITMVKINITVEMLSTLLIVLKVKLDKRFKISSLKTILTLNN